MVRKRIRVLACILFSLSVLIATFMTCCGYRSSRRIIGGFERHKNRFVTVAEYIESLDWEGYPGTPAGNEIKSFGFRERYGEEARINNSPGVPVPEQGEDVRAAVRLLFTKLRYEYIARTFASGKTIFFEITPPILNFSYYNEGVCCVIDGGEPTPVGNYDDFVDYVQPLGDNWYYWNGHSYYG